jgi:DNA topoisomerase-3
VVKGFTGKKGKFDAVLVLKEDMTIGFSFPWIENSGTKAVDGNKETSRKNNENEVE